MDDNTTDFVAVKDWNAYNAWNLRDQRMATLWTEPLVAYLKQTLAPTAAVLDFGCGYFDVGLSLMSHASRVDGYDVDRIAVSVSKSRLAREARTGCAATIFDNAQELPTESYDAVVMNSVIQYFSSESVLEKTLQKIRTLLRKAEGRSASVFLVDVIPPEYSSIADALHSFSYAARNGCAAPMLRHLFKAATKPAELKLLKVSKNTLDSIAKRSGFEAEVVQRNLTPSRQRYTAVLRPV